MFAYIDEFTASYRLKRFKASALAPSIWSSILMAVGGIGDALLYVYLPVKGDALGMSLFTIGFLLSVNKFARLFTNRWVAYLSKSWGIKNLVLAGTLLSGLTTFVYALNPVIWLWILSRVIWGLAFSGLRFSTIQYAGISKNTGNALGIGRSIQETGPILAYWIGPFLINSFGAEPTFLSWSFAAFILLPVIHFLPDFKSAEQHIKPFSLQKPTAIDIWIFISSFAIEGLLVVGVSKVMNLDFTDAGQLLIISALYISSRRLMNVIISPIAGWMSDRFSFKKIFQISCILLMAGLLLVAFGLPNFGILVAYLGSAVNMTLIPVIALEFSPVANNFDVLTKMSTSRDLGSAIGSLIALNIFAILNTTLPFAILSFMLMFIWYKIPTLHYDTK